MPINFIPNDPQVLRPPMRVVSPRPQRAASRAGFTFIGAQPENTFDPATASAGFLFWQCREAALGALAAWEDVSGKPFTFWQGSQRKIALRPDDGQELNAFYDRSSLSFFHFNAGSKVFLSGASTDIVAHEAGHGILDSIRPDLWDSPLFEVNAFHEAFGDCVAILTALLDGPSRAAVLPAIARQNFIASTGEDLAAGVKASEPNHNAAAARNARNAFVWQLPSTLPDFASPQDGPGKLINEGHSFGQIFSGCFYDLIVNIFKANGGATEGQLRTATRTAGRLLSVAIATAPLKTRFFREVGRAMVKADEEENAAANRDAIRNAFNGHDLPLGTGAMLAPIAALAGAAPTFKASAASLTAGAKKDLLARMGATGRRTAVSALRIGGTRVAEVLDERDLSLGHLASSLRGVVTRVQEAVLVGASGGRAAVLGALPEPVATSEDVDTFVRSLLKQGAIDLPGPRPKRAVGALASRAAKPRASAVTHEIRSVGGKKVLSRVRFACRCCVPALPFGISPAY